MRRTRLVLLLCKTCIAFTAPAFAQTDPQDIIDELRQSALAELDSQSLGAGYAAMVSFAVSPDISAATFYPDSGSDVQDARLKAYRLPYRYTFNREREGGHVFVEGLLAYQTLDAGFAIDTNESVASDWRTWGGSVSLGYETPLSERLSLFAAVTAGFARLENRAHYDGLIAETYLRLAFEGIVFDWFADANIVGGSISAEYQRPWRGFDLEIRGGFTDHYISSTDASSPTLEFSANVLAFDVDFSAVHPTSLKLGNTPLAAVFLAGNTTFLGEHRNALDFNSFYEIGAAIEADVSARNWKIKKLRLGLKLIYGAHVDGWSMVLGHSF
ncbi:MAG: hypothetical protein OEW64_11880 [Gammaproteobacteria bacterium]|nr:hypothetical protein [Gammaproteobacteria bacterium]MDH5304779.1 hypothetical protein [Gammaproteobacteria bacterium]MDH5323057.1 hypothetical protein [Gammaproteobacteria bacterium]